MVRARKCALILWGSARTPLLETSTIRGEKVRSGLVRLPPRPDKEDVDGSGDVVTVKPDAPLPHAQAPFSRNTPQWANVTVRQSSHRRRQALSVHLREPAEGFRDRGARRDLPRLRIQLSTSRSN